MGPNAAEAPSVWGEADVCGKCLKTEQHGSPTRKLPVGWVPNLCVITPTARRQGACVHQLQSQGIVMTQGTRQGTKQTRFLPCGAPTPVAEQGEHISRDCVSGFIHVNLCTFQTGSVR